MSSQHNKDQPPQGGVKSDEPSQDLLVFKQTTPAKPPKASTYGSIKVTWPAAATHGLPTTLTVQNIVLMTNEGFQAEVNKCFHLTNGVSRHTGVAMDMKFHAGLDMEDRAKYGRIKDVSWERFQELTVEYDPLEMELKPLPSRPP